MVGILALKTKVVLIIIYAVSSFLCRCLRAFLSLLVASPDYLIRGRVEVHSIPAIRYNE
jgi:hypothetical protein